MTLLNTLRMPDISTIKSAFPLLVRHPQTIYLDSAATALVPSSVLSTMEEYYTDYGVNISRGVYQMSSRATQEFENTRQIVADFIHAPSTQQIVFTSGTTAGIGQIAYGMRHSSSKSHLTVAVTKLDHHANFASWQSVSAPGSFCSINLDENLMVDIDDLATKITADTDVLALPLVSNVLGTITPVNALAAQARALSPDITIVVDAAQAIAHLAIDVSELDCDFLVFSAHKLYGPTGTGILWGKSERLRALTPLLHGGDMIQHVHSTATTLKDIPHRLEAGTPNIAGVIGLGAAINFVKSVGMEAITTHEKELTAYTQGKLKNIPGLNLLTQQVENRIGVFSFTLDEVHPHDLAAILDEQFSICVRAGAHCAIPLHEESLGIHATTRLSLGMYNTKVEIDTLVRGILKAKEVLQKPHNAHHK